MLKCFNTEFDIYVFINGYKPKHDSQDRLKSINGMLTMPLLQVSSLKNPDIENVLSINDNQETNGNLQHWYLISRRGCLVILKKDIH
jgi:hypothetical protein